ncbi:PAS domain S-box protein, partial [bacterium]|nr:PAS domain S-box protein [bacterium]
LISTVILDVQDSKTILVSIEDITDLKNSYNKLKYANEYTESIMESINDILIVTDKNNLITKVNKNTLELLEYSQNDLIGQPLAMILTQDNVDFPDIKIESLKASTNCDFELSITTKSDLVIPISCSRSSFNDPYGKLSGFVIIARDLRNIKALKTDLRELKETHRKLMHVERLSTAGILAAGISHTVGNVLANLKASLSGNIEEIVKLRYITELDQLFKSDSDVEERCKQYDVIFRQYSSRIRSKFLNQVQDFIHDTKPQKEYTKFRKKIVDTAYSRIYSYSDGLLEQVDFMDENIKGLLSLSKKDSSEKNMVNIRDVLNTARTMLNNYEKHGIYFVEEIHQSSPSLLMNFHRMLDCVLNIMLNGIESMQSGGRLTYGTYLENDKKTTIYIEDEGKGIPSEITDKISEPFFSTKNNGTGLGLSMTYNFIEEIGGNIKFESKKKGTRFTITLPC